jgi:hypothetical protein
MIHKWQNGAMAAMLGIFAVMGCACAAEPASAQMAYRIGAEQVAAVLVARGLSLQPEQVEFLAAVTSSRPDPALQVERLQAAGESVLARFRCRDAGDCLPFYVVLHLTGRQDMQAVLKLISPPRPAPAAPRPSRPKWVVRSGQRAMFVLLGKDFRATTPVICLENGRQGESIRVSSLDRKRIMVGEIVGPGLLRGDL